MERGLADHRRNWDDLAVAGRGNLRFLLDDGTGLASLVEGSFDLVFTALVIQQLPSRWLLALPRSRFESLLEAEGLRAENVDARQHRAMLGCTYLARRPAA